MMTRKFAAIISVIAIIFLAYLLLLCFPQPFFKDSIRYRNLTLYSDRPFDMESGLRVLAMAQDKLGDSPFYSPSEEHAIFICNERWRQILLFNRNYRVGGVNYFPLTHNVFLRDSIIEENRLRGPGGKLVDGDRTLDYFIVHEIAHTLTGEAVGGLRYHRLPEWIREGYADYVGKGKSFNYNDALRAFLNQAPEMNREKSGLYLRYHLLVAYLVDKKGWSARKLLVGAPPQSTVEKELFTSVR